MNSPLPAGLVALTTSMTRDRSRRLPGHETPDVTLGAG
jgi:hypothetical protein